MLLQQTSHTPSFGGLGLRSAVSLCFITRVSQYTAPNHQDGGDYRYYDYYNHHCDSPPSMRFPSFTAGDIASEITAPTRA